MNIAREISFPPDLLVSCLIWSLGPHVVAAPVAAEFVQERERLEGLHAIEEQHTVEVIGFVLDHTRGEAGGLNLDLLPRAFERADDDLARTRDAAADVGNAQAPFPVFDDARARRSRSQG